MCLGQTFPELEIHSFHQYFGHTCMGQESMESRPQSSVVLFAFIFCTSRCQSIVNTGLLGETPSWSWLLRRDLRYANQPTWGSALGPPHPGSPDGDQGPGGRPIAKSRGNYSPRLIGPPPGPLRLPPLPRGAPPVLGGMEPAAAAGLHHP